MNIRNEVISGGLISLNILCNDKIAECVVLRKQPASLVSRVYITTVDFAWSSHAHDRTMKTRVH
jgi:hypothetical protein